MNIEKYLKRIYEKLIMQDEYVRVMPGTEGFEEICSILDTLVFENVHRTAWEFKCTGFNYCIKKVINGRMYFLSNAAFEEGGAKSFQYNKYRIGTFYMTNLTILFKSILKKDIILLYRPDFFMRMKIRFKPVKDSKEILDAIFCIKEPLQYPRLPSMEKNLPAGLAQLLVSYYMNPKSSIFSWTMKTLGLGYIQLCLTPFGLNLVKMYVYNEKTMRELIRLGSELAGILELEPV